MTPQVLEGSWEEVRAHDLELIGRHVKLLVLPDISLETRESCPNEGMLAALRNAREIQRDMPMTMGMDSVALVREARAGAMYGYDITE